MNYFVLQNDESSVFGNIRRKTINELFCIFKLASFILHSAVGEFTLNKKFSR